MRAHRAASNYLIASTNFNFRELKIRHNAKYSNQSLTDPDSQPASKL